MKKFPEQPSLEILKQLNQHIPDGEGSVCKKVYCDGSWAIEIEFQAIIIGEIGCHGLFLSKHFDEVKDSNPEWIPDCEEMLNKIEKEWKLIKQLNNI